MKTKIEWTKVTWNPTTGCDKISAGCKNCYAAVTSKRMLAMKKPKYKNGFKLTTHPDTLSYPYKLKKPTTIFVNSMSDLFHKDVPFVFIQKVFEVMNNTPQHTYQVLTKRSERVAELSPLLNWTPNIWMGVSVENSDALYRIDDLRKTGASIKFLSCEPLLAELPNMDLKGIGWVIVGGESGPGSRPIEKVWVEDIQKQCLNLNIPFFFKQWGGVNKKKAGKLLNGIIYHEMPRAA